jgi:hypothetical protein
LSIFLNLEVGLVTALPHHNTVVSIDRYTTIDINSMFGQAGKGSKKSLAASLYFGDINQLTPSTSVRTGPLRESETDFLTTAE